MTDTFVKARIPIRATITRTVNEINQILDGDTPDGVTLENLQRKLEDNFRKLNIQDDLILDTMLAGEYTEAQYEQEYNNIESYGDKFRNAMLAIERFHRAERSSQASSQPSLTKKKTVKLPKIELRKFSGAVID